MVLVSSFKIHPNFNILYTWIYIALPTDDDDSDENFGYDKFDEVHILYGCSLSLISYFFLLWY